MPAYERTFTSHLAAAPEAVWARVATMPGVNEELSPWMRMTFPPEAKTLDVKSMPLGQAGFRSWLLLFGVLPIDRSDVTLVLLEPGRFLERSPMLSQRLWQHERTVRLDGAGSIVTDRLRFEPRLGGPLVNWFVGVLFRHRHAVLRRKFGETKPSRANN